MSRLTQWIGKNKPEGFKIVQTTEQKMSEITAEKVMKWIKELDNAHSSTAHKPFRVLAENADYIAAAYIAKCEEVKIHKKAWEEKCALQAETHKNFLNVANRLPEYHKENERLQAIIDGQRAVLSRLRYEIFHGGVDEINKIIDQALTRTQQPSSEAVIVTKPEPHVHEYRHRNRATGDTYFCNCGDSY
jgi:hypothetical protein